MMDNDKNGIAPCGNYVDDERHEKWRQECSCLFVGCKNCALYKGGEIHYEGSDKDIKKGLSIWAKHMLGRPGYE